MLEFFHGDLLEQILVRLDANDLIRYKSVCKSWHSLITSSRFINRHLNHGYNKERYNNVLGYRRVSNFKAPLVNYDLVGSSNGLVCIGISKLCLIVGNPLTREVRHLAYPPYIGERVCWGFGYDSSRDDYKVVVGAHKGTSKICFWLLSFKSNEWRNVGEVNYWYFNRKAGLLFNDALHWIKVDTNIKRSIISFDLSKEEVKGIPIPDASHIGSQLGIMKERLCIFKEFCIDDGVWLMKKYNVKELWEHVEILHDHEMKYNTVHFVRSGLFKDHDRSWIAPAFEYRCWEYMDAPIYVQSLVSPHDKKVPEDAKESQIDQINRFSSR
ncbi:F-box/kelch-repeat protein At3g06240-like [Bidens hawaiensis]|uniref:F-box/kelch-repeat protein At3g06240-like n=1 Tax=Bidens hawaiensis TaxID=980011 RepID=UPI00404AD7A0